MPRYRANVRFGPWKIREEFESTDPYHAMLAENGKLSVVPGGPVSADPDELDVLLGIASPQQQLFADVTSPDAPSAETPG
jgi:hypothetical protein